MGAAARSTILSPDLGKFKSVACAFDTATTAVHFTTVHADPGDLLTLLDDERPTLVAFWGRHGHRLDRLSML